MDEGMGPGGRPVIDSDPANSIPEFGKPPGSVSDPLALG